LKGRARILLGHFGSLGGEFPHDSDHGSELSAVHFVDVPTHDWLDGFLFIYLFIVHKQRVVFLFHKLSSNSHLSVLCLLIK
jgi:hypothetical protein